VSLRVLFCGTPAFATPSLAAAAQSGHRLVGVVTVPDRPQGRGRTLRPSPVKQAALSLRTGIYQPEALDDGAFLEQVQKLRPDILLVVAFRILPEALFGLPPHGAVNVHASLLPRYRGAAPIARALMDGATRTGVTTFQIVRRVDRGGILLQRSMDIDPADHAGSLTERLSHAGAKLAIDTLDGLETGTLQPTPQDNALATRAPKLTPDDRPIRWDQPARTSHHRVRALAPVPGALVRLEGKMIKLLESEFDTEPATAAPGTVMDPDAPRGLAVATAEGTLYLRRLQPEGKGKMPVSAWLRGHPLARGARFDSLT